MKIEVDMQEIDEDRFAGALDQKYTKNIRECGLSLNGTAISRSQRDRYKTWRYVERGCSCNNSRCRIQDHGTSFGRNIGHSRSYSAE